VNNLPKVVTQQRRGRASNPRLLCSPLGVPPDDDDDDDDDDDVQCYVMGRFGHENGPFWVLAGAVLVLFFLPLGPFWRWAVLVGSQCNYGHSKLHR